MLSRLGFYFSQVLLFMAVESNETTVKHCFCVIKNKLAEN